MFRLSTTAVPARAAPRVTGPGVNRPMIDGRNTNSSSAIIGTGNARLRTTWLMTSASVGLTPIATTMNAGIIVTMRRNQRGVRKRRKSPMIVCPAMVPTTELERPDANKDVMNTAAAKPPINGSNVRYAVSISPTSE